MKKIVSLAAGVLLLLAAQACGKKGGILPPLVLVPQKVENLKAVQRGQHIFLDWSNPESYIDGRPLAGVSEIEVWVSEAAVSPKAGAPAPTAEEFESKGRRVAVIQQAGPTSPPKKGEPKKKAEPKKKVGPAEPKKKTPMVKEQFYEYLLTEKDLKEAKLLFAVRVKDEKKGRFSDFSEFVSVSLQPLPLPPGNIRAQVFEDRIEIRWDAPQTNFDHSAPIRLKGYQVYRLDAGHKPQRLNTKLVPEEKFDDSSFLFGQSYRYFVRAAASETDPVLESDDSTVTEVMPKDIFPPAAPTGVTAVKGPNFITLVWDAGREKDLAGYKVWRREAGHDQFVCLTDRAILENTYIDSSVEKNKRYEYAITALDSSGNESPKSEVASEVIKDGRP